MTGRPIRVARGFAAAGVSTIIAGLSHAAGGGQFPHAMLLIAGLLFSGLFCTAVAGRRVSFWRVIPAVAGSQALFHLIFSMTGTGRLSTTQDHHHGMSLLAAAGGEMTVGDAGMLVAHVFAAAATILALRYGEAAIWGLAETARLMLAAVLHVVAAVALPRHRSNVRAVASGVVPAPLLGLLAALRYRGPPVTALSV